MATYTNQNCTLQVGDTYISAWKKITTGDYWGRVTLTLVSQDQATRRSTLSLSFNASGNSSGTGTLSGIYWRGIIRIGDTTLFDLGSGGNSPYKNHDVLTNRTVIIQHDEQGAFSPGAITAYIGQGYSSPSHYATTTYNTVGLETIPVSSGFSVSPETSLTVNGSTISYTITPGSSSWTHQIGIALSNSSAPSIILDTVAANTTTGTIAIPASVADIMTSQSQTLYITCQPFNGSIGLGYSRVARTFIIPSTSEFLPTMSLALSAVDSSGTALIYGYVAGMSHLEVIASNVTVRHNATLSYISTTVDSIEYYLQPSGNNYIVISDDTLKVAGTVTVTSKIVDSRGLTTIYSNQISVLAYSTPEIISLAGYRANSSGNADAEGQYLHIELYYTITSIIVNSNEYNGYMYKLGYKKTTDNTYIWVEDTTPSGTNIYTYSPMNVSRSLNVLVGDISSNYDIRFILYDRMKGISGQATEDYVIRAAGNVFFNFRSDGLGLGIGKLAELQGGIDLGWKLRMSSGIVYTELSANVSIDTMMVPGFYIGSSTNGNIGGPISGDFGLIVKDISPGGTSIMQEFCASDGSISTRYYDGTVWSSWFTNVNNNTLQTIYPVGSIYISTVSTNPSVLFGFGTWVSFGEGRVLIGVGTGTDFNGDSLVIASESTGGEYSHKLVISEMPSHGHTMKGYGNGLQSGSNRYRWGTGGNLIDDPSPIQKTGGDGFHNNVQPYIGVYMWHRTA